MAREGAGLRGGAVGVVHASVGGEAPRGDGDQVYITVRASFARVFPLQAGHKNRGAQKAGRHDVIIKPGEGSDALGGQLPAQQVEGARGGFVDADMVRVPVTSKGVKSEHDIRL